MEYQEVSQFFDGYKEYARKIWSLDEPEGELTCEGFGNEEYRISSPGISLSELQFLSSLLPSKVEIPGMLACFWSAYRFFELGLPLVSFYPTEEDSFRETTVPVFRTFSSSGFVPFATDESSAVSFCIDLRNGGDTNASSVALLRAGVEVGQTDVIGPVFSSFGHLLQILTTIMNASETLCWEGAPSQEQIALIQTLKALDPAGFGGVGWRARWAQWVFRGADLS